MPAAPVGGSVLLKRPWEDESLVHKAHSLQAALGSDLLTIQAMEGAEYSGPFTFLPIQNGAVGRWERRFQSYDRNRWVEDVSAVRLRTDGTVSLATKTSELSPAPLLNIRWILTDVANTLSIVERVRQRVGKPEQEYALYLELRYDDHLGQEVIPVSAGEWRFCDLADEQGHQGRMMTSEPKNYGPYTVGSAGTFPALMLQIYQELETSAGRRPKSDISFEGTVPLP